MPEPAATPVRVWDLPTRAFHWLLALTLVGSFVTGTIGGNAMVWHLRCGYVVLALLLFRLIWGLVGGRWSRFVSFAYPPAALLRYLRAEPRPGEHLDVGHNPLGALSVFALLGLLVVQVATGLVADDEIATVGPLNRFVKDATGLAATYWHKVWGSKIVFALVLLHIAAIVFYLRRGTDLVRPMLSGDKPLPPAVPPSADTPATRSLAFVLALGCSALVAWVVSLGG